MIETVKKFVIETLENRTSLEKMVLEHLLDTEMFTVVLFEKITGKKASEELRIAALAHDIERGFRDTEIYNSMYKSEQGFLDDAFLKYHQERSAEILKKFLENNSYPADKTERICHYVKNHEIGGDFETDILKDADSISFFINNSEHFIKVKTVESSVEKVREKLKWMFERISFEKARDMALPYYENAMKQLNN